MKDEKWFRVGMADRQGALPPTEVMVAGGDCTDAAEFAGVVAGAILAVRQTEAVWGNDVEFGAADLTETGARLLLLLNEREDAPGGFWHFENPADIEREGYGDGYRLRGELLAAARRYVEHRDRERGES